MRLEITAALDACATVEPSKVQHGFSVVTDVVNITAFPRLATLILTLDCVELTA